MSKLSGKKGRNTKPYIEDNESIDRYGSDDENLNKNNRESIGVTSLLSLPGKSEFKPAEQEQIVDDTDYGNNVGQVLHGFGHDMNKAMQAKKRRIENFTVAVIRSTETKMTENWQKQYDERLGTATELGKNFATLAHKMEATVNTSKEQDEKLLKIFNQQLKCNQQNRTEMMTNLAAMRKVIEKYQDKAVQREADHSAQNGTVLGEMQKELINLQKKCISDGQKAEVESMKKSLQSILFS